MVEPGRLQEYQTVVLAAFLHDIGKFWQRTGQPHGPGYDQLTKSDYGEHGAHSKWSASFIEQHLPPQWHETISPVLYHHNPSDRRSRLICIADWLSSGERERSEETRWQLQPVFTQITLGNHKPELPLDYYYPLASLKVDDTTIFPSRQPLSEPEKEYGSLWGRFLEAHQQLVKGDFNTYFTNLYDVLLKYTWCIPSAGYKTVPDISLFDHSRTTSALAACLYLVNPTDSQLTEFSSSLEHLYRWDTELFLFIEGNLSGIQSYLYEIANIGHGGVAKRLRARSFYLSCLVEIAAHRLLHSVAAKELPITCKLISSGGKFILIAPNLPEVRKNLDIAENEINHWLYQEFQGELTMLFGSVSVRPSDFQLGKISLKLTELDDNTNQQKTGKLTSLLYAGGAWNEKLFSWQQKDYTSGECKSCHKMPAEPGGEEEFCTRCERDRQAGEQLIQACYIAYCRQQPASTTFSFFADQPYYVTLCDESRKVPSIAYLVERLAGAKPLPQAPALRRFLANHVPYAQNLASLTAICDTCSRNKQKCSYQAQFFTSDKRSRFPAIYSFNCLAATADGAELLGILRGDIDRLGLIFSLGLGDKASLSRIATLSRQLDLFLSGWVDYTLETSFPDCYTIYSGGDDFLFVASWNQAIKLAHHLNSHFIRFVANNPEITLSAGIAVTKPTFPIAKSSQQAGEYVDIAKKKGRNRLHVFATTVPWTKQSGHDAEPDFGELADWFNFLDECLGNDKFASAFLYRLLGYARQCRDWQSSGEAKNLLYLSHLAYDIVRNVDEESKDVREKLVTLTDLSKGKLMAQLVLPITWVLLKQRR